MDAITFHCSLRPLSVAAGEYYGKNSY